MEGLVFTMTEVENRTLVNLLKLKSEELMEISKTLGSKESDIYFSLSCKCANVANEIHHLET